MDNLDNIRLYTLLKTYEVEGLDGTKKLFYDKKELFKLLKKTRGVKKNKHNKVEFEVAYFIKKTELILKLLMTNKAIFNKDERDELLNELEKDIEVLKCLDL